MTMSNRLARLILTSTCCSCFALTVDAGVLSLPFDVTARYNATCEITDATKTIDFGTLYSNASASFATGSLNVMCQSLTPFKVWAPLNGNASGSQRRLVNSTSAGTYLQYNVTLSDINAPLPNSSANPSQYTTRSLYSPMMIAFTVTIPAGQALVQGYYTDTLTLTVDY